MTTEVLKRGSPRKCDRSSLEGAAHSSVLAWNCDNRRSRAPHKPQLIDENGDLYSRGWLMSKLHEILSQCIMYGPIRFIVYLLI